LHSFPHWNKGIAASAVLTAALTATGLFAHAAQDNPAQEKAAQAPQAAKGMPPRATPADYQAHVQAGAITIGAEFSAHSVPVPQGVLSTEDYIVVEVGFFGAPEAHATISANDFSLRVNDKKSALPAQPYSMIFASLKDPEWEPPVPVDSKGGKTSIGGGGGGAGGNDPPVKPKPPFSLQRTWQQNVQKAALPEGERVLPAAGLIFFRYSGQAKGIYSVELIYSGPAGKATLTLHP
jgi:hypothetical protein